MNIFVLDRDPKVAAAYHCNKHVVKMILEAGQMLSTSHWLHLLASQNKTLQDFKRIKDAQSWLYENTDASLQPPWKMTHTGHPCTIWTGETISNYFWHVDLAESLLREYTKRYHKHHKSETVIAWLRENVPIDIDNEALTEFPQCVPDDCKISYKAVDAYKQYYINYKNHFAKWEPRATTPAWYQEAFNK